MQDTHQVPDENKREPSPHIQCQIEKEEMAGWKELRKTDMKQVSHHDQKLPRMQQDALYQIKSAQFLVGLMKIRLRRR